MGRAIVDQVDFKALAGPKRVTISQVDRIGVDIPPILELIVNACNAALSRPVWLIQWIAKIEVLCIRSNINT